MNAVLNGVKNRIRDVRDRILEDIIRRQKSELDKKIDSMLKKPMQRNLVKTRVLGLGKSMGMRIKRKGVGISVPGKKL